MENLREDIKKIFEYLKAVKKIDEKTIRTIEEYGKTNGEQVFLLNEIPQSEDGFLVNISEEKDSWLEVNRNENPQIISLYNKLFKLYQFIELSGEDYELIYSDTLLAWKIDNVIIKHPLLTTGMVLKFDEDSYKFVFESSEGNTTLETDFLDGININNFENLITLKYNVKNQLKELRTIKNSIEFIEEALFNLTGELDQKSNVIYQTKSLKEIEATEVPKVYYFPSVILRRRNEKIDIQDLDEIIEVIDNGGDIPETIQALVVENEELNKRQSEFKWEEVEKDLLFPLPANEDQKEIARRIANNFGVVVQGPPGTGKSHTIVNLICHLLANGKRILVTSQREKALTVLRDKIPEEIRSLCISVLGNDKNAINELDESIRTITDNISLDKERLLIEIKQLEEDLKNNRIKQSVVIDKLREIEKHSNKVVKEKNEEFTLIEVAKWVNQNEEKYGFLKDPVEFGSKLPLTNSEYLNLISLINSLSRDEMEDSEGITQLIDSLPKLHKLVKVTKDLEKLTNKEKETKNIIGEYQFDERIVSNLPIIKEQIDRLINQLKLVNDENLDVLIQKYWNDSYVQEITKEFLEKAELALKEISPIIKELALMKIDINDNGDFAKFKSDFNLVYNELKKNGKIGLMFKLSNKGALYIMEQCHVNNKGMEDNQTKDTVKNYIKKREIEEQFLLLWNNYATNFEIVKFKEINIDNIYTIDSYLQNIKVIMEFERNFIKPIRNLTYNNLPKDISLYKYADALQLKNIFVSIEEIADILKLNREIEGYKNIFEKNRVTSGLTKHVYEFDYDKIYEKYREFDRLIKLNKSVTIVNNLLCKLRTAMPLFYDDFKKKSKEFDTLNLEDAYKFLGWKDLLNTIESKDVQALEEELAIEKDYENYIVLSLVDKKTWYNQIVNMTDKSKRSLYAWLEAMKKIGKGTGKYANYYKKLAKQEMGNCKSAIPVWIMPFNKVIENLSVSEESFDVIIFDESSQSNIMALQALFRGKKAVIVGDDNQISPIAVGYNKEEQFKLIDKYLNKIPNKEWFDLETSLYSTALRIFPNKLLLKEHFRSVPEIIEFSNEFAYGNQIIPLRYPKSGEKFKKPVIACKVQAGEKENENPKKVNISEAEALVKQVVECSRDPKYNNMTFGVISLLGSNQGELISNMLNKELGEKEMIKRKLICGDAYSFQGDERDIIFLSLVVSNNVRFTALTKEEDKRRFNVAATRARNQMWLFHSVNLEDLNPSCIRYSLLEYFLEPIRVLEDSSVKRFSTNFEKDLYYFLKDKGLVINSQVKVGRYIVDLVIEGRYNRLAIECDGDKWQGIEVWEQNREYRCQLERVGWEFLRIKGYEFYRNPQKSLARIEKKLRELDIKFN